LHGEVFFYGRIYLDLPGFGWSHSKKLNSPTAGIAKAERRHESARIDPNSFSQFLGPAMLRYRFSHRGRFSIFLSVFFSVPPCSLVLREKLTRPHCAPARQVREGSDDWLKWVRLEAQEDRICAMLLLALVIIG
jgi:hypothetical protein